MTQARNSASDNPTFRVRATFAPLTHLELISFEPSRFEQELGEKSQQAPMFFRESPLVLSLERLAEPDQEIDFAHLLDICHRLEIKPIAIRGGTLVHQSSARGVGLLVLPANKSQAAAIEPEPAPEPAKVEAPVAAPQPEPARRTKLIDHPVRSGQQIYAAGADLIGTAPVSPGAELLADGHIHVYGPLRGRALAGVLGNTEARIFCRSLEAELVSIAGQYKISEDLQNGSEWRKSVQIILREDRLVLEPI